MQHLAPSHLNPKDLLPVDAQTRAILIKDYGPRISIFEYAGDLINYQIAWSPEYEEALGEVIFQRTNGPEDCIFDACIHGYNGKYKLEEKEALIEYKKCTLNYGSSLILLFQYSGQEPLFAKENQDQAPEDYFDWFGLFEKQGQELKLIYSYECA